MICDRLLYYLNCRGGACVALLFEIGKLIVKKI